MQQAMKAKPIQGLGTGTSDSIQRNMRPGSYVMPSDSTKKMTVPVKVSNGESAFTPEQLHALGAKVLDLVKGSTHKPVSPGVTKGPIRKMADGGLIKNDPNALDSQAASDRESIGKVVSTLSDMNRRAGAAIADVGTMPIRGLAGAYDTAVVRPMRAAGINAAYTSPMVSPAGADPASQTPFYDRIRASDAAAGAESSMVNPPVVNPMATMPSVQAGPTTSAAGAGFTVPRPAPAGTVAPDDVSGPRLTGAVGSTAGTSVDGAPGVSKFMYSNVAGAADNDKLMSANPGVQTVPGLAAPSGGASPAATAMSSPSLDAELSAARSAAADRGDWQAVSDSYGGKFNDANNGGNSGIDLKKMLGNGGFMRQKLVADTLANTRQNDLAEKRLAMDSSMHAQDATLKTGQIKQLQQVQAAKDAYAKAAAAGDTKAMAQYEETLRVMGIGRDRNIPPPRQLVVPGGTMPDPNNPGQYIHNPSGVFDPDTKTWSQMPTAQSTAAAPLQNHIANLKAHPETAAQFDLKYGKGAAAQYLGTK